MSRAAAAGRSGGPPAERHFRQAARVCAWGFLVPFTDPWFWAFASAVGWVLAACVVASPLGRSPGFGVLALVAMEAPRVILTLPVVAQPRLISSSALTAAGVTILIISAVLATPAMRISGLTRPQATESLRTDGLFSVVRHPIMLCAALWPLGLSLLLGSTVGVLLTPVWFALAWLFTFIEEDALVREFGAAYRSYQERVPRLLPTPRRLTRRCS